MLGVSQIAIGVIRLQHFTDAKESEQKKKEEVTPMVAHGPIEQGRSVHG